MARSAGRVTILLALALSLAACTASWQVTVSQPDGNLFLVDAEVLHGLDDFSEQVEGKQAIPVERLLVAAGHSVVDELVVSAKELRETRALNGLRRLMSLGGCMTEVSSWAASGCWHHTWKSHRHRCWNMPRRPSRTSRPRSALR